MATSNTKPRSERQQYWLNHLLACEASGQTTIDYARAHGIKVKSMYSARKALVEHGALPPSAPCQFQKVQVADRSSPQEGRWQVQLPNGIAVSFTGHPDGAALSLVLSTAAALS